MDQSKDSLLGQKNRFSVSGFFQLAVVWMELPFPPLKILEQQRQILREFPVFVTQRELDAIPLSNPFLICRFYSIANVGEIRNSVKLFELPVAHL